MALLLEHVNLNVPDEAAAVDFYQKLGAVRVLNKMVHRQVLLNIGASQIHLLFKLDADKLEPVTVPQVWRGAFTVWTTEDLDVLADRLSGQKLEDGRLLAHCPWGNRFILERSPETFVPAGAHLPKSTGAIALSKVEHAVPVGTLSTVMSFYRDVLCLTPYMDGNRCVVPFQHGDATGNTLEYFEEKDIDVNAYDTDFVTFGYHLAFYLDSKVFRSAFVNCDAAGCVYENPRFKGETGNGLTWEDAETSGQFRTKDIIDPASGLVALVLEHEIRSTSHPSCPLQMRKGHKRTADDQPSAG